MDEFPEFHGRIADPKAALDQLDNGATVGEVEVIVAAFGILDTNKPHGVHARQVIDKGAFRSFLEKRNTELYPVPYFVDHGHAMTTGFFDSRLKIGKSDQYREEESALRFRGLINLRTELARDTFSMMLFDPQNTPHSFSWGQEHSYRGEDGFDHVDDFDEIREVSYCGRAAQMTTGVLPSTMSMRAADDRFPHHDEKGVDVAACRTIVADLNNFRTVAQSGPSAAADRRELYAHAVRHLREAGEEDIAPLRATLDEMRTWAADDPEYASAMREALGVTPGGDGAGRPRNWLDEIVVEEMRTAALQELARNADAREKLRALVSEAEREDPSLVVTGWYDSLWAER